MTPVTSATVFQGQGPAAHLGEEGFRGQATDDTDGQLFDGIQAEHIERHQHHRQKSDNHIEHDALGR